MHIKRKILFIGDALSSLKLESDTSLAFCEAALNIDFEVFWCEKKDLSFIDREIFIHCPSIITHASINSIQYKDFVNHTAQGHIIPFSNFDFCFIRTDPPFDDEYKDLCWLLNTQTKVKIYNPPSTLLNFHEKALPWRAYSEGVIDRQNIIPTCLSQSMEMIRHFLDAQQKTGIKKFITKPWLGYGGADIQLWHNHEELLIHVQSSPHRLLIQPFLDEIYTVGDRRVILVNGEIICSFVRIPPKDKVASNLAQGGSGVLRDMTQTQIILCQKIAKFLIQHSIVFAGLDLIGEKIGEINITSPTGFRAYEKMTGLSVVQNAFENIINNKVNIQ